MMSSKLMAFFIILFLKKCCVEAEDDVDTQFNSEFGKCEHGELSTHETWSNNYPLYLEYDPYTKISCIEVLEGRA